jgi:hypothetical protein
MQVNSAKEHTMPSITRTPEQTDIDHPQPSMAPPKVPGEPAPDEDKCNLPDQLESVDGDGDISNQPAYDKDTLRRLPAD